MDAGNATCSSPVGFCEYMQKNEARGGTRYGQYQFSNTSTNPLNTNFAFSNAVLGVFSQYTETDKYGLPRTVNGGPSGTARTPGSSMIG